MNRLACRLDLFAPHLKTAFGRIALLLTLALACAAGHASQDAANDDHGLVLKPFDWQYDGQTIQGVMVQGATLHGQPGNPGARLTKILLMPMGWMDGDQPRCPKLVYETPLIEVPEGKYIAVNLKHGAALSELIEPGSDTERKRWLDEAIADRVQAVLSAVASDDPEMLPGVTKDQFEAWKTVILEAGGVRDSGELSRLQGPDDEQRLAQARQAAEAAAYGFWPMIFAYSVVAGSETTQVQLVSLYRDENTSMQVVFARLIEGLKAYLSKEPNAPKKQMAKGDDYNIKLENGKPTNPDLPTVTAGEYGKPELDYAQAALEAGWAAYHDESEVDP